MIIDKKIRDSYNRNRFCQLLIPPLQTFEKELSQ